MEHGFMPGAGAVVAAVVTASGVEPVSLGKPGPLLLEVAAHAIGRPATEAVMIGDSLITDIPAAIAVGARSVLMLTGISTAAQLAALPAADRPTEVAANAEELAAALDRLARE
jgi:ribonucleotide monophosphatase NagD (HAD superfamily)